ncbi:UNVERIFIED_CONTAM: hypothetical protein Scaly_2023400 [Sesamum calycinum]|uniref:Tf2-1-like SH3-like domain-containing protein n=1 Tax=Sesamum calycinum TaxID=2727403 RepID=A0AAW2N371_9LAMI
MVELLGFHYKIHYKPEKENVVADALSCIPALASFTAISSLTADIFQQSQDFFTFFPAGREFITSLQDDISMDFATHLPNSSGKMGIWVVVDRLKPRTWFKFLSLVEFWYNTSFHDSIGMAPFEALYSKLPPSIVGYSIGLTKDKSFSEGDLVYLKLQTHRQCSIRRRPPTKLTQHFYGPFRILRHIGPVRTTPVHQNHPVFHISLLKPYFGQPSLEVFPQPEYALGTANSLRPIKLLASHLTDDVSEVLVQWEGCHWRRN